MIWVIAQREFSAMFLAPLAWVILAVVQVILGYMFLTNLDNFAALNEIMAQYFEAPYPARAAIQVSALPRGVSIEIDGVMTLA